MKSPETSRELHVLSLTLGIISSRSIFVLEPPFGGLGATYTVHLRLIGKLVVDFLFVIIELFFARCFRFVTIHECDGQTDIGMTATVH